jgi:hypothetical protein
MRKRIVLVAAGLALCVCGGSGGGGNGSGFDQALTGDWSGTRTVALAGFAPRVDAAGVTIQVSGSTANITPVCPQGNSSITFQGSGSSAHWTGPFTCSIAHFPGCGSPGAYVDYDSGSLSLGPDKTLTLEFSGVALFCAGAFRQSAVVTFVGTK